MRYVYFIVAIALIACNPVKRLERQEARNYKKCVKFAPYCVKADSATTITRDTIYHDTTVYITQAADTIILNNPCAELCDSFGNLKPFERVYYDRGIVTTIRTVNNRLEVNCAVDSLEHIIDSLTVVNSKIKTIITKIVPVDLPPTWWQKTYKKWFWLSWAIIILLVFYKYFRHKLPF